MEHPPQGGKGNHHASPAEGIQGQWQWLHQGSALRDTSSTHDEALPIHSLRVTNLLLDSRAVAIVLCCCFHLNVLFCRGPLVPLASEAQPMLLQPLQHKGAQACKRRVLPPQGASSFCAGKQLCKSSLFSFFFFFQLWAKLDCLAPTPARWIISKEHFQFHYLFIGSQFERDQQLCVYPFSGL